MHSLPAVPRGFAALAAVGLTVVVLSGCSTQSRPLARVGDRTISESEFREMAAGVASRYMMPPDTAKGLLLDDLIRRELLLVAARGNPALPDSFVAMRRAEIERDVLSRALLDRLTPRDVGVSDAEVRRLYAWRQTATHVQLVFAVDETMARAARHAIDAGEDFGVIATRFDMTGMLPPGGDLGFIGAGQLVSPIDRIVREGRVGAIIGPVEAPGQGWFIVHILGREPREQPPLDQQRDELRGVLTQRKQRITLLARYAELRNEYHVEAVEQGLHLMFERLNASRQLQSLGAEPSAALFSPQDRAVVVGRWDGGPRFRGTLTMGEAIDDLDAGRGGRISTTRYDSYVDWVRSAVLLRVAVIEARRRHLDEEPATAEQLRQSIDDLLLQAVYQNDVVGRADPTDQDLIEVYERNAPALAELKSVRVQYMTMPESAMAVNAAARAQEAGSLKNAVMASSASMGVHEETVVFPTHDPVWQLLQVPLTRQPIGAFMGPIRLSDGWRIVQLVDRVAPVPAFDQLPQQAQQALQQRARDLASERRLKFFTDSLRTVTPVVVDRERLKRIPWPGFGGMQVIPGMPGS